MKTNIKQSILLIATAFIISTLSSSCKKDAITYRSEQTGQGSLSFAKLKVEVDKAPVAETQKAKLREATDLDVKSFQVVISHDSNGETSKEDYHTTVGELPELIKLSPGQYKITIASAETPQAAFDSPVYAKSQDFEIKKDDLTYLNNMVCRLHNIGIKVVIDPALMAKAGEDFKVSCTIGKGVLDYSKTETRIGYFKADEEENYLTAEISGTIDGNKMRMKYPIMETLTPGEVKILRLNLKSIDNTPSNGSASLSIKIDANLEDVDDNKTIDTGGESAHQSDKPLLFLSGAETLPKEFSMNQTVNEPLHLKFIMPTGMKSLMMKLEDVELIRNNPLLQTIFGNQRVVDLVQSSASSELTQIGLSPNGTALNNKRSLSFSLNALYNLLLKYPGVHSIGFMATDKNGKSASRDWEIIVKSNETPDPGTGANNPRIEGTVFDHPIRLAQGSQEKVAVAFKVYAPNGIKSFRVEVTSSSSDGLQATMDQLPFTSNFDLCNLSDEANGALEGFKFPTRDKVSNKRELNFALTDFTNMIAAFPGKTIFTFTITDSKDLTVTKAITFNVE